MKQQQGRSPESDGPLSCGLDQFNPQARTLEKFCAFITAPEGSTKPLEERLGLFPSFADFITHFRSLPENQAY